MYFSIITTFNKITRYSAPALVSSAMNHKYVVLKCLLGRSNGLFSCQCIVFMVVWLSPPTILSHILPVSGKPLNLFFLLTLYISVIELNTYNDTGAIIEKLLKNNQCFTCSWLLVVVVYICNEQQNTNEKEFIMKNAMLKNVKLNLVLEACDFDDMVCVYVNDTRRKKHGSFACCDDTGCFQDETPLTGQQAEWLDSDEVNEWLEEVNY